MRAASVGACLLVANGVAIAAFGPAAFAFADGPEAGWMRAAGVASIGYGLAMIGAVSAVRRGSAAAWWLLWSLPAFWLAHLLWGLPPGKDHVHQIVLGVLAVAGLVLTTPAHQRPMP